MSDFELLFSVFGLLIGLTLVEIAVKFADAIDAIDDAHGRADTTPRVFRPDRRGATGCSPGRLRDLLTVRWRIVFIGLTVSMIYYFAASMIFPRSEGEWKNLDEHYWARKRLVIEESCWSKARQWPGS